MVLTHNRRVQLLQTLRALSRLPDGWPVIGVDNGAADGTAGAVAREFPNVLLIRSRRNIGAAARNIGVAYVHTPYVAFCDDDTQWEPGALERAGQILDAHPQIAVLNGCVKVGDAGRIDPACISMARSPLDRENLPGPQLLGFMAGACVVRTRAFYEAGGYWPPLFIGGEEELLALDLADRGWRMVYVEDVVTRHFPSRIRNNPLRERLLLRNAIWVAWLRLPFRQAWRETVELLNRLPGAPGRHGARGRHARQVVGAGRSRGRRCGRPAIPPIDRLKPRRHRSIDAWLNARVAAFLPDRARARRRAACL